MSSPSVIASSIYRRILEPLLDRDERNWPFRTEPLQDAQEAAQAAEVTNDASEVQSIAPNGASNFHITDDRLGEGGPKTKFENNIRAIRTLKTHEKENRPASPEDQEVLSQYVGWGGIPQAFDEHNAAWADEYRELKSALTEEEYEAVKDLYDYYLKLTNLAVNPSGNLSSSYRPHDVRSRHSGPQVLLAPLIIRHNFNLN